MGTDGTHHYANASAAPVGLGRLNLADFFPAWQRDAACLGRGPERWYPVSQGDPALEARAICCRCPVLARCLDAAIERREDYGIHGGAGEAERRTFARARQDRDHGPEWVPGCRCQWCAELARHVANLDAIANGRRRVGDPGDRNGPGATHGRRSTYARGCRCDGCRWSASSTGQALARAGLSTADLWAAHVPEGTDWPDARRLADDAATEALGALSG